MTSIILRWFFLFLQMISLQGAPKFVFFIVYSLQHRRLFFKSNLNSCFFIAFIFFLNCVKSRGDFSWFIIFLIPNAKILLKSLLRFVILFPSNYGYLFRHPNSMVFCEFKTMNVMQFIFIFRIYEIPFKEINVQCMYVTTLSVPPYTFYRTAQWNIIECERICSLKNPHCCSLSSLHAYSIHNIHRQILNVMRGYVLNYLCIYVCVCVLYACELQQKQHEHIKKTTQHRKNYVNSQISVIYVAIVLNMEFRNIFFYYTTVVFILHLC